MSQRADNREVLKFASLVNNYLEQRWFCVSYLNTLKKINYIRHYCIVIFKWFLSVFLIVEFFVGMHQMVFRSISKDRRQKVSAI